MALGAQRGSLWTYYLNWFVIALFGTGTLAITWTRALTRALTVKSRPGPGIGAAGSGAVGIFAPALTRGMIDAIGWRWAFVCLGALPILVAVPTTLLFFHERDSGGVGPSRGLPANYREPRLWLLGAVPSVLFAAAVTGIVPNLVKILTSSGLERADAVTAAGAIGLCVVIGRLSCGALLDRLLGSCCCDGLSAARGRCLLAAFDVSDEPAIATTAAACVGLAPRSRVRSHALSGVEIPAGRARTPRSLAFVEFLLLSRRRQQRSHARPTSMTAAAVIAADCPSASGCSLSRASRC